MDGVKREAQSTDLVSQLRIHGSDTAFLRDLLMRQAADEIERLRCVLHRLADAELLLSRCDVAMRRYFSNEFDGGAQFSELTSDVPAYFRRGDDVGADGG